MGDRLVYLDNAAATRLDERVFEAVRPYLFDTYAVATSEFGYSPGIEAREDKLTRLIKKHRRLTFNKDGFCKHDK